MTTAMPMPGGHCRHVPGSDASGRVMPMQETRGRRARERTPAPSRSRLRSAPLEHARERASRDDAHRRAGSCRRRSRTTLPMDLAPDSAPRRALELERRSTPAVDRKVEPPAHRLSAGFEAALKSFFNQCRSEAPSCCATRRTCPISSSGISMVVFMQVSPYQRHGRTVSGSSQGHATPKLVTPHACGGRTPASCRATTQRRVCIRRPRFRRRTRFAV